MSWEVPAADTKYTQQLALDVGDIPGHQVRRILVRQVSEYKRRHDCLRQRRLLARALAARAMLAGLE
jgi:hypothetical protein